MPRFNLWTIAGILLMICWVLGWMLKIAGQIMHGIAILALVFFAVSFFLRGRDTGS